MRMLPAIGLVVIYLLALLIDLYIISDIRKYSRRPLRSLFTSLYIVFAAGCFALLTWIVVRPADKQDILLPLMWMIYSFATVYLSKLLYLICSAIGRLVVKMQRISRHKAGKSRKPNERNHGVPVGAILAILLFTGMWVGVFYTRVHIDVEKVTVKSSKLPVGFDGYRIVQFSDAHVGSWGSDTTFISKLVDKINSLNPDLIVFTGDIVNRHTPELYPFVSVLSRLKAKDGVYSILGNHDYGDYMEWASPDMRTANNEELAKLETRMGWKMLNNSHDFIKHGNDSIVVIGVENWGEPPFPTYGDLSKSYPAAGDSIGGLNDSRFKLLLSHNPEHWNQEVTKSTNIDLTLSGHTHAMQMMVTLGNVKLSPSRLRYEQWGGLYERSNDKGDTLKIYVNIGCGEVGIPARFGTAYPEITEITLKR